MRIISGIHRSKRINAKIPSGIRPTTDRVKETAFNILNNIIDLDDANVLDLYAGTGLLGFEALSRGAASCKAIELSGKTVSFIKNAAKLIGFSDEEHKTIRMDAIRYLKETDDKYDLILADPPYHLDVLSEMLIIIAKKSILEPDGIIMFELAGTIQAVENDIFRLLERKDFGDSSVLYYEYS